MKLINKMATKTSLGCLSKGWYTDGKDKYLVKGNSNSQISDKFGYEPFSEVLAYNLGKLLGLPVVDYSLALASNFPEIKTYDCEYVSVCKQIDLNGNQLVSYCTWADLTNGKEVKDYFSYYLKSELSNENLAKMLVFDAIIGNCDRHLNNFDVIITKDKCQLAPIFDNGASLLAYKSDSELQLYNGIGFDKSKPFKPTHTEQVNLVKRRLARENLFSVNVNELYDNWVSISTRIFSLLPSYRAKCIQNYVKHRLSFLSDFNENIDGGATSALDVF